MLSRCPVRYKLLLGTSMLLLIVAALAFSSFRGVYAYRELARSISLRATELPLAEELTRSVNDLRFTFLTGGTYDPLSRRQDFRTDLNAVRESLDRYRQQLRQGLPSDTRISDTRNEWATVRRIEQSLDRIKALDSDDVWMLQGHMTGLQSELDELHGLTSELPGYMYQRMHDFRGEVRSQYRVWIILSWVTSLMAVGVLGLLLFYFNTWIFRPLNTLILGSRRVATGDFGHRIRLTSCDEMAELAAAMNAMTQRFQEIRDDLDRQVKSRTKEVVRSEQLASVGFLAAGVAHEINNPLASIAWCAESLESRLHDLLHSEESDAAPSEELVVLKKYLRTIQDEAFRCKGITERLLDFSRMGDVTKQDTDLRDLIEGVIEMVRHLGKYRQKQIEFVCDELVVVQANGQEIKQVVLNLITNALDSLDPGGLVTIQLARRGAWAEILFTDSGCGMTDEVLEHLFEPFFTRRRDGQGTGLGLSISYRIISDHGGQIEASSGGPGHGSQFRVTLPLLHHEEKREKQRQVAASA